MHAIHSTVQYCHLLSTGETLHPPCVDVKNLLAQQFLLLKA